jgi:hypothetical protein
LSIEDYEKLSKSPLEQKEAKSGRSWVITIVIIFLVALFGGGYLIGFALAGYLMGILTGAVLEFAFINYFLVANWISKWLAKKTKAIQVVDVLIWLNLFTWLIPVLGMFTSSLALNTASHLKLQGKKYKTLSYIGIILSIVYSCLGILAKYK